MAVDLYIYNATSQALDTTSSFAELLARTGKVVPPGAQAHLTYPDAPTSAAAQILHASYGAVQHATVGSPATFAGKSLSPTPVAIAGKNIPVV